MVAGAAHLDLFKPTDNLERFFCRRCGSHVFTADRRLPLVYGFPAGLFEGEAIEAPTDHYFVDDKVAWSDTVPGATSWAQSGSA